MIVGIHRRRHSRQLAARNPLIVEPLENRLFLSAVGLTPQGVVEHQGIVVHRADSGSPAISGYTPTQIRKAYGFDQISLGSGVTADGSGQTIAIVDPYNDPNVAPDLAVFDQQFGIAAAPELTVVNQNGDSQLPATNGSWAGEIATDVEWAHAIAPGAKILLVEANSDNTDDLMSGVSYAIAQPGVSVISLSWGGGEFSSQTSYDSQFNTPAGHAGVTVLAAAGDNGAASGAQWPASAPDVVAVGGSVLKTADSSGNMAVKPPGPPPAAGSANTSRNLLSSRSPSAAGTAPCPTWRSMPTITSGRLFTDTVPYQGVTGWQTTNGTSVGTPEWAALVAIANQGRALAGQAALDGPGQTLPLLYSLYGAPGTDAYSTYTNYFNDITTPENPQATTGLPELGYDLTTGLGSPKAAEMVTALVNSPSAADLAARAQTLASPVNITLTRQPPMTAVDGTSGTLRVRLSNDITSTFNGPILIKLTASTDGLLGSNPIAIKTDTIDTFVLRSKASRLMTIPFAYPSVSSQGDYYILATLDTLDVTSVPAQARSTATVSISRHS